MQNKPLRRNVLPVQATAAGQTYTSGAEKSLTGSGVRFYVTVSGSVSGGGTDHLLLCAVPPGSTTPVPLLGYSAANMLSQNGTFMFDFYPSAWLPSTGLSANGHLLGAAGVYLPQQWAVQLVIGAGNSATSVAVDAELLP